METVKIHTEYITLGQLLKFVGIIDSGFLAKMYLEDHYALINGAMDNRRGRKIYVGDVVVLENQRYLIESE